MKFDEVIEELGEFGRYQKFIYTIACLAAIPASMHWLASVFIQAVPDHRCKVPGLINDTWLSQGEWHDELVNASIPWDKTKGVYEQCSLRRISGDYSENGTTVACDEWVYSQEQFSSTIVSDTDLVCDRSGLTTYASMVFMSGTLGGAIILGFISDIVGRKTTLQVSCLCLLIVSFGTAWADSYYVYISLRFLVAFFVPGIFMAAFVIGMELVAARHRGTAGLGIQCWWCIGLFIETAIGYVLRDWRMFQMAISAPILALLVVFAIFLPESPRWLLQKGKTEKALKVIETVADKNGVTLSNKIKDFIYVESDGKKEKIWSMFTHLDILIRCLIVFFNWLVSSMVYYGLSLNSSSLSGNIYLNFFLMAFVELLSYFFSFAILDKTGRKWLQCFSMVLGGMACICTIFPVVFGGPDVAWVTTALSLSGKFGVSIGFAIIYIYSAEIFPTVMRNSCMGISSFAARIGSILAPFIGDLGLIIPGTLGVVLPLLIFGGLCVIAGLLVLFLPETANRILPDTIEEARNFGKREGEARNNVRMLELSTEQCSQQRKPLVEQL